MSTQPGQYGFASATGSGGKINTGINGGVGGGAGYAPRVLFYVGVPSVEAALATAERLGGRRLLGPEPAGADFTVGRFADQRAEQIAARIPDARFGLVEVQQVAEEPVTRRRTGS